MSRKLSRKMYRLFIEAIPEVMVETLDTPLTRHNAIRRYHKEAAQFAAQVKIPSRWYATDGTGSFYLFREKRLQFSNADFAFARLPWTRFGINADQAYRRHNGQLTDRRPSGWVSAATLSAVNFGGLDGGPRDWGLQDNEDLDLRVDEVERLRAKNPNPYLTGHLGDFAERVKAKAGR